MAIKPSEYKDDNNAPDTLVASELDPLTHAEFLTLYRESTDTLRFIKSHQWKTVGATLIAYLGIVFIGGFVNADLALSRSLMSITIVLCCAVIFTLVIYQFWMHNEMLKINSMQFYLSSGFSEIRALKLRKEGDIHRYLLLFFMIGLVILGALVVSLALSRIAR